MTGSAAGHRPLHQLSEHRTQLRAIRLDRHRDDSADRDPQSLLAPRIGAHRFANVMTIEAVLRRRLHARIGLATPEEMEQVSNALRAVQDL